MGSGGEWKQGAPPPGSHRCTAQLTEHRLLRSLQKSDSGLALTSNEVTICRMKKGNIYG